MTIDISTSTAASNTATDRIALALAALETPAEWYNALGYSPDGHHCHPVCAIDEVDAFVGSTAVEEALHEYAEAAAEAAHDLSEALLDAVGLAARGEDREDIEEALDRASRIEREYGDDPSVQRVREILFG